MEVSQTTSKELISYTDTKKKSKHGKHRGGYYSQNKEKYLLAQKKYRSKKQANKPKKQPSSFQQTKTQQLLKLLVNHHSFVPVPPKLKHPIIKEWNADNYWYKPKLDLNNLERGCVRIFKDNWNNCAIIWLDIDCKKWTKLAKLFRCGYLNSPKGNIRIPVPIRNLENWKTGVLAYQSQKIGDTKLSGEVMLPNMAYYDKSGKFLGFYRYKAWGTFFPLNNKIWANPNEFFTYLTKKSGIEYLTIKEHFIAIKAKEINQKELILEQELLTTSMSRPPWQKMIIHQRIPSQNRQQLRSITLFF